MADLQSALCYGDIVAREESAIKVSHVVTRDVSYAYLPLVGLSNDSLRRKGQALSKDNKKQKANFIVSERLERPWPSPGSILFCSCWLLTLPMQAVATFLLSQNFFPKTRDFLNPSYLVPRRPVLLSCWSPPMIRPCSRSYRSPTFSRCSLPHF